MNVADKICEKAKDLPEPFAREVLAFIERIIAQRSSGIEDLKMAQEPAMKRVWENTEDDIWNELYPGDLVGIPCPYSDLKAEKRRPVLVITPRDRYGDLICAAVTSVPTAEPAVLIDDTSKCLEA